MALVRKEVLPGWYQWVDESTGEPVKLKPHEEKERSLGDGRVPPTSTQAARAGYKVESRSYPCPEPGARGRRRDGIL